MRTPVTFVPISLILLGAYACAPAKTAGTPAAPAHTTGALLTLDEYRQRTQQAAREDSIRVAKELEQRAEIARQDSLRSAEEQVRRVAEAARMEALRKEAAAQAAPQEQKEAPVATDTRAIAASASIGSEVLTTPAPRPKTSVRTDLDPEVPASSGRRLRRIQPRSDNPAKITVTFLATPIEDVIGVFSSWSGRTILLGEGVQNQKITADIYSQPWHVALETLLSANGLEPDEDRETGIISIRSQKAAREAEGSERPAPEIYKINYAEVKDLAPRLSEVFGDRVKVTEITHLNSLLISASPETLNEVEQLMAKLDVRQPTVRIAAQIISVARGQMASLGLRYGLEDLSKPYNPGGSGSGGNNGGLTGMTGMPQVVIEPSGDLTNHPPLLLNRKGNATLATFISKGLIGTPLTFSAFVDAMQGESLAEVHAAPVISTISDKAATIEVGDAYHVPTLVTAATMDNSSGGGSGGRGGSGMAAGAGGGREQIRVGISLDVTPHVTNNGQVWLKINAKRSGGEIDAGGTIKESYQSGKTEMILESGETGVIGGLNLTESHTGHTGVPILKDLPVIGSLFRTQSKVHGERELIILVTPTILRHPDDMLQKRN